MSAGVSRAMQTVRKALDMLPIGSVIDSLDGVGEKLASWTGIADLAAKSIEQINKFFDFLDQQLEHLKPTITEAVKEFMDFFKTWAAGLSGADGGEGFASKWQESITKVKNALTSAKTAISNFFSTHFNEDTLANIWTRIKETINKFVEWLKGISIGEILTKGLAAGGVGGLVVGIIKSFDGLMNVFQAFTRVGNGFAGLLDSVRDAIKGYETELKSKAIINVAKSIAILAGSIFLLSLIPLKDVAVSTTAVGVALAALVGGLAAMDKYTKDPKKIAAMSVTLVALSVAVLILSVAAVNLAKVPIPEMVASVTAVTALVIALAGMTKVLSTASGGLTKKVLILLAMAIAVYILAKAVTKIASIPIQQMAVAELLLSVSQWPSASWDGSWAR